MCFACSLLNFTSIFSLLFAYFRFKFFASLHFSNFRFEAKQSKIQVYFFAFFHFKSFASLRFSNFRFEIFASHKRKPLNLASIQYFLHYFASQFYLCFCFRFLVFRIGVNHMKSGFFSLQFQISLPKRKWGLTLVRGFVTRKYKVNRAPSCFKCELFGSLAASRMVANTEEYFVRQ